MFEGKIALVTGGASGIGFQFVKELLNNGALVSNRRDKMFEGKVALVTGGASGIGFQFVKELLRNGARGVTLVDVNAEAGEQAAKIFKTEFGSDRLIFFQTDVGEEMQLKETFKTSFEHWKGLDILINNAGIVDEKNWERTVSVNIMAPVRGTYLGFEYMSKNKGGKGGVIVNVASISGIEHSSNLPTYSGTKSFVLTICPGVTLTSLGQDFGLNCRDDLCPDINDRSMSYFKSFKTQTAEHVGSSLMGIIEKANNGSVWVIEEGESPYEILEVSKTMLRKN
ncbi:hypothetical protein FQR65_LT11612 [Abscondita terminalis]|nr:hypothetical protein FQR65_LT11612 [Abscondita terminalis]